MKIGGWGRYPIIDATVTSPRTEADVAKRVGIGAAVARGNGRAYGDCAVSRRNTIDMRRFNRMLAFDQRSGQLVVEAGVLLEDVIKAFLPRGWFPAVTPGTKHVTLGGMVAADVHGKNHHRDGGMARVVDWLDIMDAEGRIHRCSRSENTDLFHWTLGGMGLTGVVLRTAFRLRPVETGWIRQDIRQNRDLSATLDALEAASAVTYAVAWIDCLAQGAAVGRSLLMLGEHARLEELGRRESEDRFALTSRGTVSFPIDPPIPLVNGAVVRAFNQWYYRNGGRKPGERLIDWERYFYPLDRVRHWNRLYGRRGFVQFQCVLPLAGARSGLEALLKRVSQGGRGAFLAVLKRFGCAAGPMSFPMPGYSLALDFPVNPQAFQLLDALDRIVIDHGGRFYLAKDARMRAQTLTLSSAPTQDFKAMRNRTGSASTFTSVQSERLAL